MAEEMGRHPGEPGPEAGHLPGDHRQVGDGGQENPLSAAPGPGGPGESAKKGEELWVY